MQEPPHGPAGEERLTGVVSGWLHFLVEPSRAGKLLGLRPCCVVGLAALLGCSRPTEGGAPDAALGDAVGETSSAPPAVNPELLVATYVGGAGDQYFTDVSFDGAGHVVARMGATTLTYDLGTLRGAVDGATDTAMNIMQFPVNYPLPRGGLTTNTFADERNGQTYTWGTHPNVGHSGTLCPSQCAGECTPGQPQPGLLQMAFVRSSAGWHLWDFDWDHCVQACVVADSRAYDLFPLAGGAVGMMLWTDGGDTPLHRGPVDVSQVAAFTRDSFGENPGGRGVLFARIDPSSGTVTGGTWLNTHALWHVADPWGRVLLSKSLPIRYGMSSLPNPTNPFNQSTRAESGLFVLRSDFTQPEAHFYLGGDPTTCASGGVQSFDAIALSGGLVALAGTTCATDLHTTPNAVQSTSGGGHDGFFALVRLWR